ncbi:MAG TPA: serine hydrolase [Terriglobales bacterium]
MKRSSIDQLKFAFLFSFPCVLLLSAGALAQPSLDSRLTVVDSIINDAIAQQQIPGAVLIVGHDGRVAYRKAYGDRALEPRRETMTLDTIFDCASVTKVVATTTAILQLWEQGKFRMNDPVAKYLPEFAQNGKQDITIRQLLVHYSGLAPDLDLTKPWEGKDTAERMAFEGAAERAPGSQFVYSDINFVVLGALVERLSGQSLGQYAQQHVFAPLGMNETRYNPPPSWEPRIAPTEEDENHRLLRGVVHDPTARRMGGVAGHAGVFSTADDLAIFAQALLDGGRGVLTSPTIAKMIAPQQPVNGTVLRGFGWDIDSPLSSNRGELLPVGSYGHTGFTGTSLWIDPTTKTYIVLLTNAVHMKMGPPKERGSAASLRTKVATAVAAALALDPSEAEKMRLAAITGYNEMQSGARKLAVRNGIVKTGIDVLEETNFATLHPKKGGAPRSLGLLTNQTGVDTEGRRTIDILASVPGISLDAIFSPEHGVTGTLDTLDVKNTKDAATGVTVYSVYGGSDAARHPPMDVLKRLDAVVIDVADVGARFYTYEATIGYFLETAAKADVEIVILDRPNPITGSFVQGPMSDEGTEKFTNYFPEPVRHGMTLGELAKMVNAERHLGARLDVVAMEGWQPGDWFDSTGLPWVNTSPNLRSVTEAILYPGVAEIEGTNVSVGRGTDTPFEVVGAPWIKAREFSTYMNARGIQSVRFVPIVFTPSSSNFAGERCEGVNLIVLDRNTLDSPELGIELASALHKLYPNDFKLEKMMDLLSNQTVYDAIQSGEDPRRIAEDWQERLDTFIRMREKYLLYK